MVSTCLIATAIMMNEQIYCRAANFLFMFLINIVIASHVLAVMATQHEVSAMQSEGYVTDSRPCTCTV